MILGSWNRETEQNNSPKQISKQKTNQKLKNRNKWRKQMLYSLVTEGLQWGVGGSLIALQNVSVYLGISQKKQWDNG